MGLYIGLLISFIFFVVYIFTLWRKLKEDYIGSQIFGISFLIYFSLLAVYFTLYFFNFIAEEWLFVFVPFAFSAYYIVRHKMRFNEVINALVPAILFAEVFYYFTNFLVNKNYLSFAGIFVCLLLLVAYAYLEKNFKKYHWYRSGKVGFSGFMILTVFFLINAAVAFAFPGMLFFTGKISVIISLILAAVSLGALVTLSKRIS